MLPLAPLLIVPKTANLALGTAVAALLIAPVVVLRRKRWVPWLGAALLALLAMAAWAVTTPPIASLIGPREKDLNLYAQIQYFSTGPAEPGALAPWFLPWNSDDLLLFALTCLAEAALLPMLGRSRPSGGAT
ncbi:hypothetical protein [Nonomuraea sp. NPDC052265]|uniref:hypothetical protein n=1 Tax=Nonomuraea sp. NPDC052265 TaxID=3364374 RepID=UPI0037C6CEC4